MTRAELDQLSYLVIAAAIEVHSNLGPGLLESVYLHCMAIELEKLNIAFEVQRPCKIQYKNQEISKTFIVDIMVENSICLELKSVESILPVHSAQLMTYLKLTDKRLGFLLNFNVTQMKEGIKRIVYKF